MGVAGDIGEVVSLWRGASWRLRVWLILSGFVALGPIASLSEEVRNWKGFFKDGVDFYREWISTPLQIYVLPLVGLHFPRSFVDFMILYFFVVGSFMGSMALVSKDLYRGWHDRAAPLERNTFFAGGVIFAGLGMLYIGFQFNKTAYDAFSNKFLFLFMSLYTILIFLLSGIYIGEVYKKGVALLYLAQLAAAFLVVGIMAALSVGLTE